MTLIVISRCRFDPLLTPKSGKKTQARLLPPLRRTNVARVLEFGRELMEVTVWRKYSEATGLIP